MGKEYGRKRIDRRTILKGVGASAVTVGASSGLASAHHVADLAIDDEGEGCPDEVIAGESFEIKVHFQSGHGTEACFVTAISPDGNEWTKVGEERQSNLSLGEHRHFQMESTVPENSSGGMYTLRLSATERPVSPGPFCPHPGETDTSHGRSFVKYDDCAIEVLPPVEVDDVEFKGCSEVWSAFEEFPVDETDAEVNVDGTWEEITIEKDELTKIPGQYGHDTPVYKHSVDAGQKLVGFRIVGDSYENDHRCAENV
ncbi:hypothetical protein HWV07_16270 [Natronomonas salina]|uniref:hypothetical protein n=1 Tax=Natronomonas salina TaxID=1710540 RepID=UPI0015B73D75|nr:hypothetical protein [Natronomonas salina]QLD90506.1 hypothetical protein HWV07_16270 [Natronomonas salina]